MNKDENSGLDLYVQIPQEQYLSMDELNLLVFLRVPSLHQRLKGVGIDNRRL